MRIGFDLDGVGHHFGNGVRDYLNSIGREYGWKDGHDDGHSWSFYDYWHMSREEFNQVCNDGVDAGYIFRGNVRPNFFYVMREAYKAGNKIIIITDRQFGTTPDASHRATKEWLKENNAPPHELFFSADKTLVSTDMFVEDKLENYDALTRAGTECWLINRPWNTQGGPDSRNRIDDVLEYKSKILSKQFQLTAF